MVSFKKNFSTKLERRENAVGWLFIILPLLGTVVFSIVPTLMSGYLSFTMLRGYTPLWQAEWIGFDNYYDILIGMYHTEFYRSILNTFILMLQLPVSMIISMLLAVALNRKLFGAGAFRVIYYIPCLTTSVVIVIIFQNLFNTEGSVNRLLSVFGIPAKSWLNTSGLASVVIIVLSVWKNIGGSMLMFLAGLQSIGKEYYEAAELDGANGWQKLIKITVPLLKPMTFFMLITGVMGAFQAFNEPYLMFPFNFGMGPEGSTETVMVFMYYQYANNNMMGLASAISWLLAIIIFVFTVIQFWYNKRTNREG